MKTQIKFGIRFGCLIAGALALISVPGCSSNKAAADKGSPELLSAPVTGIASDIVQINTNRSFNYRVKEVGNPGANDNLRIICQPQSDGVPFGSNVTFSVLAERLPPDQYEPISYQWEYNTGPHIQKNSPGWSNVLSCVSTNSALIISNVQIANLGFYRVRLGEGLGVISEPASLVAWSNTVSTFTVCGPTQATSGGSGNCPGPYNGYVNYTKVPWGWTPNTAAGTWSAEDGTARTNTRVQICGSSGDAFCRRKTVSTTAVISAMYRFTIYFPANVPNNNAYPCVLGGFNE